MCDECTWHHKTFLVQDHQALPLSMPLSSRLKDLQVESDLKLYSLAVAPDNSEGYYKNQGTFNELLKSTLPTKLCCNNPWMFWVFYPKILLTIPSKEPRPLHSLGQVGQQDTVGVLLEVFLEGACEVQQRLACGQLGALHHALLVEDKEVSTAGQHVGPLIAVQPHGAVLAKVLQESQNQLREISDNRDGEFFRWHDTKCRNVDSTGMAVPTNWCCPRSHSVNGTSCPHSVTGVEYILHISIVPLWHCSMTTVISLTTTFLQSHVPNATPPPPQHTQHGFKSCLATPAAEAMLANCPNQQV